MNKERIAELTSQAYSKAQFNAEMKAKDFDEPTALDIWNEFPEVFAELIAKECLKVVKDKVSGKYYFSHDDTNIARDETALDIYQDIKQHFGVAE